MATIEQALQLNIDKESYLQKLHGNSVGWITLGTKDLTKPKDYQWKERHYKIQDLKSLDLTGANTYISLNTFYKPSKASINVKEINCLYSDIDYYKEKCEYKDFTKEQILMDLEANYFNKTLPIPNFIIDSGRGLYLIWLIEPVPYKALGEWNKIQRYIQRQLSKYGADDGAIDVSRVLRVPGSINSKSNTRVTILEENDYIYTLREVRKDFYQEDEEEIKKKAKKKAKLNIKKVNGRNNKVTFVRTYRSLYYLRAKDLEKLCELRNYDMEGYREVILFLYRYWLCFYHKDSEIALEKTLELNSKFKKPLKVNELKTDTKRAETVFLENKEIYNYTNKRLLEMLDITEEEQKQLKTIISKDEYKRRNNEYNKKKYDSEKAKEKYQEQLKAQGKISKKEEVNMRRQKIKDLLAEGLSQKEIYTVLNISKRTCINDFKYLKEQGLI